LAINISKYLATKLFTVKNVATIEKVLKQKNARECLPVIIKVKKTFGIKR
jgi:hypothetical protein